MWLILLCMGISLASCQTFTCSVRSYNPPSSTCEHPDFTPSANNYILNLTAIAQQNAAVSTSGCPSRWTYLEETDSCYKTFVKATFAQARAECNKHDADLVTIHSQVENDFVLEISHSGVDSFSNPGHSEMKVWIGLTKENGVFKWVDGTTADFINWQGGEPNNVGDEENCGQMRQNGKWNDLDCDVTMRAFVCEKQIPCSA